jgi:flagellar hook-associated protein 1
VSSLYQIGTSGLMTAQTNISTAGHNIANVETPGFTRQRVQQTTNNAQSFGGGFIGNGARVVAIDRVYDEFLVAQLREASSNQAASSALNTQLSRLSNLLGDDATGLGPVITEFFASVHDVAQNPTDAAARGTLLSAANAMTGRVQDIDEEMQRLRRDTNLAVSRSIDQANTLIGGIAALNDQIALTSSGGGSANDFLDQRDQLVRELGQLIKVNTIARPDGSVNVFMGTGQALITGGIPFKLQSVQDPKFPDDLLVAVATLNTSVIVPTANIGGGEIFGYLNFRDGTLTNAQNGLGRVAQVLAVSFNEQHRLGQDKYGVMGGNFFTVSAPQTYADTRNIGTGNVSATVIDATALMASDYLLRWDGANYSIRRSSDGTTQTFATLPQTIDGLQISVSGTPTVNDSFLVLPNRYVARDIDVAITDPNRIAIASPVRSTAALPNLGNGTISQPAVIGPTVNINLQQPVTLTFVNSTTFNVTGVGTGNPLNVPYVAGGLISYNGWSIRLDGAPRAGDTFSIGSNVGGIGDAANAQQLAGLQTRAFIRGETPSGAYGSLVAEVGNAANGAAIENATHTQLLTSAEEARDSLSGVNLDEEAANLLRFQSAYQASARFIAIAGSLFQDLLASIR